MSDDTDPIQPPAATADEKTVPYERFRDVVAEKNTLKERIAALSSESKGLEEKATRVATLLDQIASLKATHQTEVASLREDLSLSQVGFTDPEAITVARALYQTQPADGRPESVADWIRSFAAEGASPAPRALAPYLPQPPPPAVEAPAPAGDLGRIRSMVSPRALPPSSQHPGAPPSLTADSVRAAREEAARTGDWSGFRKLVGHNGSA